MLRTLAMLVAERAPVDLSSLYAPRAESPAIGGGSVPVVGFGGQEGPRHSARILDDKVSDRNHLLTAQLTETPTEFEFARQTHHRRGLDPSHDFLNA